MGFSRPLWNTAVLLILLAGPLGAQVPSARHILELSESEQAKFVNETIDAGFPDGSADQMTMLIINRSALVLPLLERRVVVELRSQSPSKDVIATATEMIAYAGNDHAFQTISRLIAIDADRFGPLVERTLDNAMDFRNPFTLAYRRLEIGDEAISRRIAAWADARLATNRMQRLWAEAMVDRYQRVPDGEQWANDPLAVRLNTSLPQQLRESVVGFAKEASARRGKR
jgi:hypothetical protein